MRTVGPWWRYAHYWVPFKLLCWAKTSHIRSIRQWPFNFIKVSAFKSIVFILQSHIYVINCLINVPTAAKKCKVSGLHQKGPRCRLQTGKWRNKKHAWTKIRMIKKQGRHQEISKQADGKTKKSRNTKHSKSKPDQNRIKHRQVKQKPRWNKRNKQSEQNENNRQTDKERGTDGLRVHSHSHLAQMIRTGRKPTYSNRAKAKKCTMVEQGTMRTPWSNKVDFGGLRCLGTVHFSRCECALKYTEG